MQRELVRLFLDEARLLRYLQHPNITATCSSGRVFGTYFIAMEYVRGPMLKALVEHCGVTVGSVPQAITLNLAAQLCDALDQRAQSARRARQAARPHSSRRHARQHHHFETGLLMLIDFGLAKARVTSERPAVDRSRRSL